MTIWGVFMLDYLSVKEAGAKWGVTSRMVALYYVACKIEGMVNKDNLSLISKDTPKPADGKCKKTQ